MHKSKSSGSQVTATMVKLAIWASQDLSMGKLKHTDSPQECFWEYKESTYILSFTYEVNLLNGIRCQILNNSERGGETLEKATTNESYPKYFQPDPWLQYNPTYILCII